MKMLNGMTDIKKVRFLPCGDSAVTVEFSNEISDRINREIRFLATEIVKLGIEGIREAVPTFCSLTVYFDPLVTTPRGLKRALLGIMKRYEPSLSETKRVFLIPVCYDGEYAPDMDDVCDITGLTREEVVKIHTSRDYLIYMLGFLPGFPYLGGMDERIEAPRLDSPRTSIPKGSVGIGGKQTGIYPIASPGGWRLIGRTPVKIYSSDREKPIPYEAGDYIRFYPVSQDEFEKISAERADEIEMIEI